MGIRGLQTFITKQVLRGTHTVDIKREIHSWKLSNPYSTCLIVIDLYGFVSIANRDKVAQICGGRFKQLQDEFEAFCQALLAAGAKLAFFADGPHQSQKDKVWYSRQDVNYTHEMQIHDGIASGQDVESIMRTVHDLNLGSVSISRPLTDICTRLGHFHTSIQNECDLELAQYAHQNNALAVLGQDSDFLIFGGHWQYWSTDHLDMQNLTTICYNRPALCRELGLAQDQMCLFATLAGNDLVSQDSLREFHQNMRPYRRKFYFLADYVRGVRSLPRNLTKSDLEDIAWDCFGEGTAENVKILQNSIESYDVLRKIPNLDTEKLGFGENVIYIMQIGVPCALTLHYIDRRGEFSTISDILIPLIQRQAGIVLQQEKPDKAKCSAILKISHQDPYEEKSLQPEYPNFKIELEKLLQDDEDLNDTRFRLLAWQITGDLNGIPEVSTLSTGYMASCLCLYYVVKTKVFTVVEADQILATIFAANEGQIPNKIDYPKNLNSRDLMIGHLYIFVHGLITKSVKIVGLRKFKETLLFDGIYFNNLAQKIRNGPRQVYDEMIEPIMQLRQIYANLI